MLFAIGFILFVSITIVSYIAGYITERDRCVGGLVVASAAACGLCIACGIVCIHADSRDRTILDIANGRVRIERKTDEDGTARWVETPTTRKGGE